MTCCWHFFFFWRQWVQESHDNTNVDKKLECAKGRHVDSRSIQSAFTLVEQKKKFIVSGANAVRLLVLPSLVLCNMAVAAWRHDMARKSMRMSTSHFWAQNRGITRTSVFSEDRQLTSRDPTRSVSHVFFFFDKVIQSQKEVSTIRNSKTQEKKENNNNNSSWMETKFSISPRRNPVNLRDWINLHATLLLRNAPRQHGELRSTSYGRWSGQIHRTRPSRSTSAGMC